MAVAFPRYIKGLHGQTVVEAAGTNKEKKNMCPCHPFTNLLSCEVIGKLLNLKHYLNILVFGLHVFTCTTSMPG